MKCPSCSSALESKNLGGLKIQTCPSSHGMFILQEELKKIEEAKDPDLALFDLELWKHRDQYEAIPSHSSCPSCANTLHHINYPQSQVRIEVCHECRAVWLNDQMLKALHVYLEKRLSTETTGEFIRDASHEIAQIFRGKESPKTFNVILRLIKYRIFSEFPFIKNLIQSLPKV